MKTTRIFCGLGAVLWALGCCPALAQRVQFATPLAQVPPATPDASSTASPPTSPPTATYPQPSTVSPNPLPPAVAPSSVPPPALSPPGAPLGPPAVASPPPGYSLPPGAGPLPAPAIGVPAQPPPAAWDPYATPGNTPSGLLPQDPYFQSGGPPVSFAAVQRFVQHVDLDYHWFAGNGAQELGINDVELSATFAIPMFYNSATPLLITPGFAVHFWEGPVSQPPLPAPPPDLPPRTYDAYLDAAWNPQVTTWFGGELNFRVGVYSDFNNVDTNALRYMGKGLAVLTFSPSIKIKAGVWYLDRVNVKLLPAGGICWTPNPDVYFDILFPNPKVGKRLTTWGNTDWWIYFSGNYGGGTWQITREPPAPAAPFNDVFDYNDIRIAVGLEFNTLKQLHGMFEVGGAFSREVVYQSGSPPFYPNNTVFLRAGLAY